MIRTICIAALLLAAPAALPAQDGGRCPEARTQRDLNVCASETYARADTVLNERWQQLVRSLSHQPRRVEVLRTSQRAWIRFRDAQCEFEGLEFDGGSMQPMVELLCKAHLTEQRTNELAAMVGEANDG